MKLFIPVGLELHQKVLLNGTLCEITDFSDNMVTFTNATMTHKISYECMAKALLDGSIKSVIKGLYQVFINDKTADSQGFPHYNLFGTRYNRSIYNTFEEAVKYAASWMGVDSFVFNKLKVNIPYQFGSTEITIRIV